MKRPLTNFVMLFALVGLGGLAAQGARPRAERPAQRRLESTPSEIPSIASLPNAGVIKDAASTGVAAIGTAPSGAVRTAGKPTTRVIAALADWEPAVPPRDWKSIVLHHSGTSQGNVKSIDAVHRSRRDSQGQPWLGIGYHFVVGNGQGMTDGEIQPTFRWRQQLAGAHAGTQRENATGVGVCLIGDFNQTAPTARQISAVRQLVARLAERYAIPRERVLRHHDLRATQCPGRNFPFRDVVASVPSAGSPARPGLADTDREPLRPATERGGDLQTPASKL